MICQTRRSLGLLALPALLVAAAALPAGCGENVEPPRDTDKPTPCARASGRICTIAGTGIAGDGADHLPAVTTRLYLPQDVTVAPDGRLFIADWNNHRIRALEADGTLTVVAGVGELGLMSDDPSTNRLNHPTNVTFDASGRMVIAAWHNSKVKIVDLATGDVTDSCGNGKRGFAGNGGPADMATLDLPVAVVFDGGGNLLIADQANQMIRRVDAATNIITTIAGKGHCADAVNPEPCVLGDGGPATEASFHFPIGQSALPGGRIARAVDGTIYVADTDNFRVRRIFPDGVIDTIAGTGVAGYSGDGGPAREAQLSRLSDVAVGPDGEVYVADTANNCVRVIAGDRTIATFAGRCGERGFEGDAGAATSALLDRPSGIEVSPAGDVYIADTHNQRVRVVYR